MPHSYPLALREHLKKPVITCAVRVLITRRDGAVIGLTSHVKSQTLGGVLCHATPGLMASALIARSDTQIDNASVNGFVTPDVISETDLRGGAFDEALCEFDIYNYRDPGMGFGFLGKGYLGNVKVASDRTFTAEFRSLEQMLASEIGETTSARCRNRGLSNGTCPVNLAGLDNHGNPITSIGEVTAVTEGDWSSFTSSGLATLPENLLRYGVVTWTSGNNAGFKGEVFSSDAGLVRTWQPFPFPISVGDEFSVVRGCDLKFSTCKSDFINHGAPKMFNGEPFVQGLDLLRVKQEN